MEDAESSIPGPSKPPEPSSKSGNSLNWRAKNVMKLQPHRAYSSSRPSSLGWKPGANAGYDKVRERNSSVSRAGAIQRNSIEFRGGLRRATDSSQERGHNRGTPNSTTSNRSRSRSQERSRYNNPITGSMSFLALKRIAESDITRTFTLLNNSRKGFMDTINSPIHDPDIFVLIVEILSKLAESPFKDSKSVIILDVCNSHFINSLRNYLLDLPYNENKRRNRIYWEDQQNFWHNLITFCEDVVNTSLATAVKTCRALIESVMKTCLEGLQLNHEFTLTEEYMLKLNELKDKIASYINRMKRDNKAKVGDAGVAEENPPEDFRELSVVLSREDLLDTQPFLRPNITEGGYSDVEHYLDVQFRLLREDCFGPLRIGIGQYLTNSTKWKYDNVRVYRNVKFVGPYISKLKVGHLVQVDTDHNNRFRKTNWAQSKRLIFGSLVLFTKDMFRDCIVATILDRDNMLLAMGKIPVSIIYKTYGVDIRSDDTYTMIESDVYYESYFHVLKALQEPNFATHMPMQRYIVKVDPVVKSPAYVTGNTVFHIPKIQSKTDVSESDNDEAMSLILKSERYSETKFVVSNPESWPPREELKLNESQYEAYKLALTHEFAVIQGPPGTGKTYVGLKVAETLLHNMNARNHCVMLIVCYTNHALDQFLEGVSKITKNIVRIGSQSRNEAMNEYNLMNIRKDKDIKIAWMGRQFMESKNNLKESIRDFEETLILLDILNNGVIRHKSVIHEIPEIKLLCNYYKRYNIIDPISHWLFEYTGDYYSDFNECISEYEAITIESNDNEFNTRRQQEDNGLIINGDKDCKDNMKSLKDEHSSFLLLDAKLMLKRFVTRYIHDKLSNLIGDIQYLNAKIRLFENMVSYRSRPINLHINDQTNFSNITLENRWSLYFMWTRKIVRSLEQQVEKFQARLSFETATHEEARMMFDMELLLTKKIEVLGMTTSGAARMRKLIHALSPKIVIVEEAAEVLEQHIITALPKSCEHLILIGDHQQLRPSASYMKLARQYNMEVSLFERMITNGVHSRRLDVQHRMRPEIAALISPHIYSDLENHPTVANFGDVLGMDDNVFFFSHEHREEENTNDSTSRSNHKEGDLVLSLANHLMQQGYKSDEVTILAAYSGQMFYMRRQRQKYIHLSNVKITVVDNYQGEESRIILLSLVRNNTENNIGFLGTANRICVALSRAKQGFYIFGNINMLKTKSELWTKIAATLENNGSLGTELKLKCQNHPDQIILVESIHDFDKAPKGGCGKICNYQYNNCNHRCDSFCHGYDREHKKEMKCPNKCERIICELDHVCPLKCTDECAPCKVPVQKKLSCGHEHKVYCHREPDDPKNNCPTEVEVTLPSCGHKAVKPCHMKIKDVKCEEKCKMRLEKCGHACNQKCHIELPCSETNYLCKKDCAKAKKGCLAGLTEDLGEHQCKKLCYQDCDQCFVQVKKKRNNCKHITVTACCKNIDDVPCNKKCARVMSCGHYCKKKCSEPCVDCKTMVKKVIPECKHTISIFCHLNATQELCYEKCTRNRSCGHLCMGRCGAVCDEILCTHLSTAAVDSPCGHKTKLPCNVYAKFAKGELDTKEMLKYCNNPCNEELACKHLCSGTCSECHQGRLHTPCKQICNQLNICGHQCQEPCNQICPPCKMPCPVKCAHSSCSRLCGEACVPCKEKCDRKCDHGACVKLCSQKCSQEECSLPCSRQLSCGHRCRGICGEPCLGICNVCRPEEFPKGFIREDYDDNDIFILLQDCGHIVELESMDAIMMGDQETIKMRECPYCRKPVIKTNRYKSLVNNMIRFKINPIKRKVYGEFTDINVKHKELTNKILQIYSKYFEGKYYADSYNLKRKFMQLMNFVKIQKKLYLLQVEMLTIYCDIFDILLECCEKFINLKTRTLQQEFHETIDLIIKVLKIEVKSKRFKVEVKISQQQQKDVANEIKRLNVIVQLAKLLPVAAPVMTDVKVKACVDAARADVFTFTIFDEDKALESLKILQSTIKASSVVTKLERQLVVKAMELKAGHWYKCPNGHFYCIGECGGANQVGKCPDCGALIGGRNHALVPGNSHAGEMDGSRFAAYSEEANNMANFLLDI